MMVLSVHGKHGALKYMQETAELKKNNKQLRTIPRVEYLLEKLERKCTTTL